MEKQKHKLISKLCLDELRTKPRNSKVIHGRKNAIRSKTNSFKNSRLYYWEKKILDKYRRSRKGQRTERKLSLRDNRSSLKKRTKELHSTEEPICTNCRIGIEVLIGEVLVKHKTIKEYCSICKNKAEGFLINDA